MSIQHLNRGHLRNADGHLLVLCVRLIVALAGRIFLRYGCVRASRSVRKSQRICRAFISEMTSSMAVPRCAAACGRIGTILWIVSASEPLALAAR